MKSIADSLFVRTVRDGLARQLVRTVNKKEPVTFDMLSAMAQSSNDCLTDLQLLTMACMVYTGFLPCEELIKIHCCDISFTKGSMSISLPSSKMDQYTEGAVVLVAQSSSVTCPVAIMVHYFGKAKLECNESLYVFRAIVHTKTVEHLRRGGHLSYMRVRELVKQKLSSLGYELSNKIQHARKAHVPAFHLMLEGRRQAQQEEEHWPSQLSLEREKSPPHRLATYCTAYAIMSQKSVLITSVSA